jgi:hypothetical protein
MPRTTRMVHCPRSRLGAGVDRTAQVLARARRTTNPLHRLLGEAPRPHPDGVRLYPRRAVQRPEAEMDLRAAARSPDRNRLSASARVQASPLNTGASKNSRCTRAAVRYTKPLQDFSFGKQPLEFRPARSRPNQCGSARAASARTRRRSGAYRSLHQRRSARAGCASGCIGSALDQQPPGRAVALGHRTVRQVE